MTKFFSVILLIAVTFMVTNGIAQTETTGGGTHAITASPHPANGSHGQVPFQHNPRSITITESATQNIVTGNSVACNAGGLHTDNSYFRSFVLTDFGINGDFNITDVSIGVEQAIGATGTQPLTVNLYTTSQPFPGGYPGSLTMIGTASINIPDQSLTIFDIPVTGTAPAGSELVVEIFTPSGQTAGNSFFIGSNPDGETAPSYLMAADCGITVPTTTATIGFPGMMIVMNVTGDEGNPVYTQNFDGLIAGQQVACQDPANWTTWSQDPCNATEDAYVSSVHSYSAPNSAVIVQNNDLVKPLGGVTTGKWYISFLVYIPSGKAGYFNTLAEFFGTPQVWAMECYFNQGGGGQLLNGNTVNFTWVPDTWQQVLLIVDLDLDQAELLFGSIPPLTSIATWQWSRAGTYPLKIDANDFFGATANDEMYFDNYWFGTTEPPIIPVELTSFTANVVNGNVQLDWTTTTETNNRGFEVQKTFGNEFQTIAFVQGNGTTTQQHTYSYVDNDVANGNYSYRLRQVDFDGTSSYSNVVEVTVDRPVEYNLAQNYPNPFNPTTNINYGLKVDSKVTLKVFDILGQEVVTLLNENIAAGNHSVTFDASKLNSGVYLYKIEARGSDGSNFTSVKKMILTK